MIKLSICIPTFNRSKYLINCLNSIKISSRKFKYINNVEIIVSDNNSSDDTLSVLKSFRSPILFRYSSNNTNIGIAKNFLKVVSMAQGKYVWLIGDDDLLLPNSLTKLFEIFNKNYNIDFYYVNAYQLKASYIFSKNQPFNTKYLPLEMPRFSAYKKNEELPFLNLIDSNISFDFLGGIFLSVFKRKGWVKATKYLDKNALNDTKLFSHFDNTFPHIKIYSRAFNHSNAYFNSSPLIVCLSGAREWSSYYGLIRSFRLIEALDEYRKSGLTFKRYYLCRNKILINFWPDIFKMILDYKKSGILYLSFRDIFSYNIFFPNFYLSIIYFFYKFAKWVKLSIEYFFLKKRAN
jgi:glycosyltransferase involved in cell wall biosynthesis